jgi:hypothetical protein
VTERRRVGELGERGQRDATLAEPHHRSPERRLVDDPVGETELVLECAAVDVGVDHGHA